MQIVCDQLELLPPELVVQRLTGDGERESLIGPMWSLKKLVVMNEIDKELARRDSWQGRHFLQLMFKKGHTKKEPSRRRFLLHALFV